MQVSLSSGRSPRREPPNVQTRLNTTSDLFTHVLSGTLGALCIFDAHMNHGTSGQEFNAMGKAIYVTGSIAFYWSGVQLAKMYAYYRRQ